MNLVTDQFIPLIKNGKVEEVSLQEAILNAHLYDDVCSAESPLTTSALYRFLIAVVDRATELENPKDWKKLLKKEKFSKSTVDDYLSKWKDRFNLYDKKYPFWQVAEKDLPKAKKDKTIPIHNLNYIQDRGANAIGANCFLVHHNDEFPLLSLSDAQIVRWLITKQNFSNAEGPSKPKHNYPSPSKTCFTVLGKNLFETIMFNLVAKFAYDNTNDKAIWEHNSLESPVEAGNKVLGFSCMLTWPTRFLNIHQDKTMSRFSGWRFPKENNLPFPNVLHRYNKTGELKVTNPEPNRLWQHYASLYASSTTLPALNQLSKQYDDGLALSLSIHASWVTIVDPMQAKILNTGESRFKWYCLEHLTETQRLNVIETIKSATLMADNVWTATSRAANKAARKNGDTIPANVLFSYFNNYWAEAEILFFNALQKCLSSEDVIKAFNDYFANQWKEVLVKSAKICLDQYLNTFSILDPQTIFAENGVWHTFNKNLKGK